MPGNGNPGQAPSNAAYPGVPGIFPANAGQYGGFAMSVKVIECKDYEEMSRVAAGLVAAVVRARHDAVLGLATGSTPAGMYRELARMNRAGGDGRQRMTCIQSTNRGKTAGPTKAG